MNIQKVFGMDLERVMERYPAAMHPQARAVLRYLHAVHGPAWDDISQEVFDLRRDAQWARMAMIAKIELGRLHWSMEWRTI